MRFPSPFPRRLAGSLLFLLGLTGCGSSEPTALSDTSWSTRSAIYDAARDAEAESARNQPGITGLVGVRNDGDGWRVLGPGASSPPTAQSRLDGLLQRVDGGRR